MADCDSNKIDSNLTALNYAEEECLKQLPVTPTWYGLKPNSYSDFGGELTKVARAPIDASRQNQKGTVTDLDASGGINTDVIKDPALTRLLQGFFFADAREPSTTKPLNGAAIVLTSVDAATKTYAAASGLGSFVAGQLIFASGFANASNNGVKTVVSSTAGTVVVSEVLVNEAAPPAAAMFSRVGGELLAGDVSLAVVSGIPSLVATTTDFTTFPGLFPGKWLFIGGDASVNRFANNVGFARIKSISATTIVFDDTTWLPVTESGAGKSIRFFAGLVIRNEKDAALIKRRSYCIERQLGEGETGTQAEYLEGAVANEFTLNIPQAEKLTCDMTFVACDNTYKSGDVGDEIKSGTRVSASGGDAINSSSDIYRIKLAVIDPATSNPSALFGYASEATITITNNVTPNKAIGTLGAFDTSAGNFEVGGSLTAYFTTVAAVAAIRRNADVGLNVISCAKNAGFIYDMPLLGLGGGRLTVEKDAPIMVPLEPAAAENENGYTLLYTEFQYLPNVAMP